MLSKLNKQTLIAIIECLESQESSHEQLQEAVKLGVKYKMAIREHKKNAMDNKAADAGVFIAGDRRLWSVLGT